MAVDLDGQDVALRRGLRSRQSRCGGCGGGGGDDGGGAPAPPASGWVAGRSCRPRASPAAASTRASGTNPGQRPAVHRHPRQGDRREQLAALVEQRALSLVQRDRRSRSRALHATPEYFDLLKTNATTPSGNPKDRFHFTYRTTDWLALVAIGHGSGLRRRVVRRRQHAAAADRRGLYASELAGDGAGSQPAARRGSVVHRRRRRRQRQHASRRSIRSLRGCIRISSASITRSCCAIRRRARSEP